MVESFNRYTPLIENVSNELKTTNENLIVLGNAVENEGKETKKQLLDDTNALGNQLENGQTQTRQLITDSTNAAVNQLADNQLTREQFFQYLYDQNMRAFQKFMDVIYQGYEYLRSQPQIQPVIILDDRTPEVVNTTGFTPQAIEQVNRATALIEGYENRDSNSANDGWEGELTRNDFIAFSSLLARNFNNPDFAQFANELGFSLLFTAYCARNENPVLMSFFVRVANSKDLIPDYLNHMKEIIKRFDVVVDQSFEQYLQNTYNTTRICPLWKISIAK